MVEESRTPQARIFGGGPDDRASPCRLFGEEFERHNAEMEEMEFDFMFRHGTIVLRVEEDNFGKTVSEVGFGLGLDWARNLLYIDTAVLLLWIW